MSTAPSSSGARPAPDRAAPSACRLLAVSGMPLWPTRDGYSLRVGHLVRGLSADWRITLASPGNDPEEAMAEGLGLAAWERLPGNTIGDGGSGSVIEDSGERVEAIRRRVSELIERTRPDALLLWPGTEFCVFDRPGLPPAVGDRIDCSTLFYWRALRGAGGLRARLSMLRAVAESIRYERRLLRSTAATVVVGDADAAALRRLGRPGGVTVIPNGVAVANGSAPPAQATRPTVIFTGVLCYGPNVEALRHFVRDVWPAVRRAVPEAEFVVAGREPNEEVRRLAERPGVRLLPDVPDMNEVLGRAWMAVAPMCSGVGIKNKILEAWALGRAVVMTELASNGLHVPGELAPTVTRSPEAMAATVARLLGDEGERRRLGEAGRAVTRRHHDWSRLAGELSGLLARVARG